MTAKKPYIPREETMPLTVFQELTLTAELQEEVESAERFLTSLPESLQPTGRHMAQRLRLCFIKLESHLVAK